MTNIGFTYFTLQLKSQVRMADYLENSPTRYLAHRLQLLDKKKKKKDFLFSCLLLWG